MKIKLTFLVIVSLILATNVFSQRKDKFGNYILKELTEEQALKIFGRPTESLMKTLGNDKIIKESIIQGNKIKTVLFNYGSICAPNYLGNVADLVWSGLGYGFEFGPLAAGEVTTTYKDQSGNTKTDTLHITSDSFVRTFQGDYNPAGTLKWGWLPKDGYVDPNQLEIARLRAPDKNNDGKPDSWPESWYNAGAGKYLWPAFLGDQATAPDEEVFYVVDDFTNAEFNYYPSPSDSSKRGLGLDMAVRVLQFNNPLAEDLMFLVYEATNASEKTLPRVYFGMHGDPHVGGPSDYNDDKAFFIPPYGTYADPYPQRARNMVYSWDDDMKGDGGRKCGYFGWKFLESPTNSIDGKDNDDDGIIDESPFNDAGFYIDGKTYPLTYGIYNVAKYTAIYGAPKPRWSGDENGDWDINKDDVGVDGIGPNSPNYPGQDYGEGDGKPTQAWYLDNNNNGKYDVGEPISEIRYAGYKWLGSETNFGMRDIAESDQIGLRSFHAAVYTNSLPNVPMNDPLMWEWLSSDTLAVDQEFLTTGGDNIFNFGTGPFALEPGEKQRFSMVILFGDNLNDLVLNAETSTRILESNYSFAKPPEKPIVKAVPDKKKVTLYWDTGAEKSFDPFLRTYDFQGYKIYRSQDFTFNDVYKITDGNGVPYLGQALFDPNTGRYAQFDLIDSLSGFHPVEYMGRGIKYNLGNNTGLVHEYVDSTVLDGVRYYYAVVSYDGGSIQFNLPPTECTATILQDPITSELSFDVNTVGVIPGAPSTGTQYATIDGDVKRIKGIATGDITFKIYDSKLVRNGNEYLITFVDSLTYSVMDSTGFEEEIISKDTVFLTLSKTNIIASSFVVKDLQGNVIIPSTKYFLNPSAGKFRGNHNGDLPAGTKYKLYYKYYPVYESKSIQNQDNNPTFDGLRVFIRSDSLYVDYKNSGWLAGKKNNFKDTILIKPQSGTPVLTDLDFKIVFNDLDTTSTGAFVNPGDTVYNPITRQYQVCPFRTTIITEDSLFGRRPKYFFLEQIAKTRNNRWDPGEPIIFYPRFERGNNLSYQINFTIADTSNVPTKIAGDTYILKTTKTFKKGEMYYFKTKGEQYNTTVAKSSLDNIYVVPNPYVAYSQAEEPSRLPSRRGEQVLQFRNLPKVCTIRIYTIAGELVETLNKNDDSSIMSWNLLSYEGQRISYGVYIYHVDAPGVGEKIGRFAVIK